MRCALVTLFAAMVVVAGLVFGAGSLSAPETDFADHPLVGAWQLTADIGDGDTSCPSQVMFTAEGDYVDVDCDTFVIVGVWETTGDSTANLTITSLSRDEGGHRIRAAVEVADDGQSFTAPFTFELIDPASGDGSGEYGPGMATGTRLVAEGPGEPLGSVLDLFSQFEGTPGASPVS